MKTTWTEVLEAVIAKATFPLTALPQLKQAKSSKNSRGIIQFIGPLLVGVGFFLLLGLAKGLFAPQSLPETRVVEALSDRGSLISETAPVQARRGALHAFVNGQWYPVSCFSRERKERACDSEFLQESWPKRNMAAVIYMHVVYVKPESSLLKRPIQLLLMRNPVSNTEVYRHKNYVDKS